MKTARELNEIAQKANAEKRLQLIKEAEWEIEHSIYPNMEKAARNGKTSYKWNTNLKLGNTIADLLTKYGLYNATFDQSTNELFIDWS